jgi:ABC-type lipoprotein export system ATPase subunit/GNAT superfamily N-acetyltransferase
MSSPSATSFRAAKVRGMFDLPSDEHLAVHIAADLPLDEREWHLGLVTGPSGSGKSTIARALWPDVVEWPHWGDGPIVDEFPDRMSPQDIVEVLTAVGLSSPPAWLRPYRNLSTGQQFRASLARILAAEDDPAVVDEFTSTVDRTVAKSVSVAVAKQVRRTGRRLVCVTCHEDVAAWLQPDWVYATDTQRFTWGWKQPRPPIHVRIREAGKETWPVFAGNHYLSADLSTSCRAFTGWVRFGDDSDERLAAFFSILPVMGHVGWRRGHRTVVLPDFQGMGIGNRVIETVAEQLYRQEGLRFRAVTSAPGIVAHRRRHPHMWRLAMAPQQKRPTGRKGVIKKVSAGRLTTSWVYIPEALRAPA